MSLKVWMIYTQRAMGNENLLAAYKFNKLLYMQQCEITVSGSLTGDGLHLHEVLPKNLGCPNVLVYYIWGSKKCNLL